MKFSFLGLCLSIKALSLQVPSLYRFYVRACAIPVYACNISSRPYNAPL